MQYVQGKESTEFMENKSYKDGDLVIKGDKYLMIGEQIYKPYGVFILEEKLKKKNEILRKARIKRKNQREELHKLNLKLQKCISLEAHNIATQKLRDTIIRLKCENIKQSTIIKEEQNKEIEKLKAVIEYLESKVK